MSAESLLYPGAEKLAKVRSVVGKRRVLYDIDAICEDTLPPILAAINRDFSVNIQSHEVTGFSSISNLLYQLRPDLKLSVEQFWALEWQYWDNPDILTQAEPVPGIRFLMFVFDCAGYEQSMVTSRKPKLKDCTLALKSKYPLIKDIYIRDKSQADMPGEVFKSLIVRGDFLLEDHLLNVMKIARTNVGARIIWPSWPDDDGKYRDRKVVQVAGGAGNMWRVWKKVRNI